MMSSDVPDSASIDGPQLAAQMRPALLRYFTRKTGNPVEAEDLTHDVLTRALKHPGWKDAEAVRAYIFHSAINRLRDRRRRMATRPAFDVLDENLGAPDTQSSPERVLGVQEQLQRLSRTLQALNPRTRMVVMLVRVEQMKIAAVADLLGLSVSAVNKHLAKGVQALIEARAREERT